MTTFIVLCVAMAAAALAFVARPLFRSQDKALTLLTVIAFVSIVSVGLYLKVGHREWERDQTLSQAQTAAHRDITANIGRLENLVREQPDDVDALVSLAEALVVQDERSITGRAGELFEAALKRAPTNPKVLWYASIVALSSGQLPLARERLTTLLAQNPPENIRSIIERQIQDIGEQLGEKQASTERGLSDQAPTKQSSARSIEVEVALKPEFAKGLDKSTSLFVLARDPAAPGPPLAVARRTVGDLPLKVSLSDRDAMIAGHGIGSVKQVQVVARVSKLGTPQARPGDLFGETSVEFTAERAFAVKITIDRQVDQ